MVVLHARILQNLEFSTSQHFLISSIQVCIFSFLFVVALSCKYIFSSLHTDQGYSVATELENVSSVEIYPDADQTADTGNTSSSLIKINIIQMHVIGICLWFTVLVFEFTMLSLHCFVLGFCIAHFAVLLRLTHTSVMRRTVYNVLFFLCLSIIILLFVQKRNNILTIYEQFSYRLLLHILCFLSGIFWCLQKSSNNMYAICKHSVLTCFLQSASHVLILHDRLSFEFIDSKMIFYYIFVIAPFIKALLIALLLVSIRRRKTLEILVSFCTALVVQSYLQEANTFTLVMLGFVFVLNLVNFLCLIWHHLETIHSSKL